MSDRPPDECSCAEWGSICPFCAAAARERADASKTLRGLHAETPGCHLVSDLTDELKKSQEREALMRDALSEIRGNLVAVEHSWGKDYQSVGVRLAARECANLMRRIDEALRSPALRLDGTNTD